MKKEKYKYIFYSFETILFYIGLGLVFLFIFIFLLISFIKGGEFDYISFFFHNLKQNIFLSILTGFHVFILASGILFIFISFFRMSPIVFVYNNRFEIFEFLHKKRIIKYENIKSINVSINYTKPNIFKKSKKECKVIINNPDFVFYLSYEITGYFDDLVIEKEDDNLKLRRCKTSKEIIKEILNDIKRHSNIKVPFLP